MKTTRIFFDKLQQGARSIHFKRVALSVLLALVSCFVTGLRIEPIEARQETNPIKVMSFNVRFGTANDGDNHWDNRHQLVVETIAVADPDLLGLQEALSFQCQHLQTKLDGYELFGRGRDVDPDKGEFCAVLYRSDRFTKIDGGHFWLSETPDQPGSRGWDAALPRMATWVKLREQSNGSEFIFVNTHFDHRGSQARLESAKLIRKWMEERSDIPIVVTGDFNAAFDSAPYQAIVSDNDPLVTDTYRHIHPQIRNDEGTFDAWTGKRDGSRIDWILHSPGFETLNAGIVYHNRAGQFPSDHYPIHAVISFNADR